MSEGIWVNNDGLVLQYGTQKQVPETGGDYLSYGDRREIEVYIDLVSLTTSPIIQSFDTLMPAGTNVMIEQVEVFTEVGATGGTSFSVGIGYPTSASTYSTITKTIDGTAYTLSTPSVTALSNTGIVNAMLTADVTTAGQNIVMNEGSTYAGGYIGSAPYAADTAQNLPFPCYITALAAGTFTAGEIRVRIKYRGIGTISY